MKGMLAGLVGGDPCLWISGRKLRPWPGVWGSFLADKDVVGMRNNDGARRLEASVASKPQRTEPDYWSS
jgi:hypothetical protein